MSYKVFVDDNFHYMDKEHRYFLGEFDTAEAAIAACQKVVNECLEEFYKPEMQRAGQRIREAPVWTRPL